MTCPAPLQAEQVLSTVKKPCEALVLPEPPHAPQFFNPEPFSEPEPLHESHLTSVSNEISFLTPVYASRKSTSTSYFKSWPRCCFFLEDPPPPISPKKSSKISEKLPKPLKPSEKPPPPLWLNAS